MMSFMLQASFVGAMAIADLVKTTLGPKGMVCYLSAHYFSLFLSVFVKFILGILG